MLSGFLITGILIDSKGSENYFRNFYVRRSLRILPLYYAFFLGLLLLYPLIGGEKAGSEALVLQHNQLWVWTHMVNWLVAITGDFWTATPLGVGGFWSIAIEEQFYLVWPVVILRLSRKKLLQLCVTLVIAASIIRFVMVGMGASWAAIYTVTFARMDAIAMGAAIATIARSSTGLNRIKRPALYIAMLAVVGLIAFELSTLFGYRPSETLKLAIRCTLFVWLWGATLICTLTAIRGSFLQTLTHSVILGIFGKFSFALYLFHMHMDRLFTKFGFDPNASVILGNSVLPWQMLYLAISISASLIIAYLSWHLYEKHFLKLKAFFPTRRRFPPAVIPVEPSH